MSASSTDLCDTYSPNTTNSGLDRAKLQDHLTVEAALNKAVHSNRKSASGAETAPAASKNRRGSESPLSPLIGSGTKDEGHWKSKPKRNNLRMRNTCGATGGYVKRWIRSHPESAISKVHEKHECLTT
ncbi:hypothetical protein Tco_0278527 [Tanacetum coccineum]